jgi:uncharacterized protein (TIGR02266 family)
MSDVPDRDDGDWADRRQHPRFETRLGCSLRDGIDPTLTAVMMLNLSQGGCFVLSTEPLPEASPVALHVSLPELDRTVLLSGVVAWQKLAGPGRGMGVRFTAIDADDLALLRVYLREVAKESELEV